MRLDRIAVIIALTASILGCSNTGTLVELFRAPFDPLRSAEIELVSNDLALELGLSPVNKDRAQMSSLTHGTPAFFVFMKKGDDAVVTVSNVGDGTVLTMTVNDFGTMPKEDLQRIANTVRSKLEEKLGVPLRPDKGL